jgi:hypothetical protein
MVNTQEIQRLLKTYYSIRGETIISDQGVVTVNGDVDVVAWPNQPHLPVQFHTVTGNWTFWDSGRGLQDLTGCPQFVGSNFWCSNVRLGSLKGAPMYVSDDFRIISCGLNDLTHGPRHVGGNYQAYRNPLGSLEHLAEHIGGYVDFDWFPNVPLLRTLVAKKVEPMQGTEEVYPVSDILNKYVGQGKPGAIKAAGELIKAGFKGNARW